MSVRTLGVAPLDRASYPARMSEPVKRPPETPVTMALRRVTASIAMSHRELSDGGLLCILLALHELAEKLGATYHMDRQVLRACRDDASLVGRLDAWIWKAGCAEEDSEEAELRASDKLAPQVHALLEGLKKTRAQD